MLVGRSKPVARIFVLEAARVRDEQYVTEPGQRFAPGARVTVPFKPRKADRWVVGGVAPKALPAGRLSGKAIREGGPASRVAPAKPSAAIGPADLPNPGGSDVWHADLAAAVDPGGLKREVFGFLPYWELTDSSTRLDWEKLSTIAYFGVGAAGDGTLQKTNSDGSTTVGWSGWTSSRMTGRHQRRPCQWRAGRADRAELRLVLVGRDPPEGAARQLGTSPHPRPPDRGGRARSRRRRRQPRLRADRLDLRRRIHRAGPLGPGRAQQDLARLPADVRRDRLDRQLPDRGRDRIGRRGCGRDHGLRLQERLVEPGRIGRAARRSGLRHRRHDQGLRLARAGLEGHPRRAVLRPRLVDGHLGLRLQEHLECQERGVDDRRLWHRPSVRGRPRSEVGPGPGRGLDGLPS